MQMHYNIRRLIPGMMIADGSEAVRPQGPSAYRGIEALLAGLELFILCVLGNVFTLNHPGCDDVICHQFAPPTYFVVQFNNRF